jgi:hypothetical protein
MRRKYSDHSIRNHVQPVEKKEDFTHPNFLHGLKNHEFLMSNIKIGDKSPQSDYN